MTSKEALDRLKFIADNELNTGSKSYKDLQEFWNYKEPLKIITDLVDRDTPMKVIEKLDKKYVDTYAFYYRKTYKCGSCKKVLLDGIYGKLPDEEKTNYCSHCGQKLDWSDVK